MVINGTKKTKALEELPKFKDGDILYARDEVQEYVYIFKEIKNNEHIYSYVDLNLAFNGNLGISVVWLIDYNDTIRFATGEEKEKLFDALRACGYRWNEKTKSLVKSIEPLIKPKFKVGDKIGKKNSVCVPVLITGISDKFYYSDTENSVGILYISEQDDWVLIPNKFDINTLKPFESRVLTRDDEWSIWRPAEWGLYDKEHKFPYVTLGNRYKYCIPYEGNEHLLGTTNDCDDFYKNW